MKYSWDKLKRKPLDFKPNYNIAPTHLMPVVLRRGDRLSIEAFRWGLVPGWAKDVKSAEKYSLINARGEEIETKRSYAKPFRERRCIWPVSGFFEWRREGKSKTPFAIHLKDKAVMSIAGVYEYWESKDGEVIESFACITVGANSFMEKIHDRMPVILDKDGEKAWLESDQAEETLKELLRPCPSKWLDAYEVSTLVNSPKNNRKEVLEPVS